MKAAHPTKTVIEKNGFAVKIYPMTRGGFTICYKGPQGRVRETVANFPRALGRAQAVISQLCAARGDMLSLSVEQVADYRAALARLNGVPLQTAIQAYLNSLPLPVAGAAACIPTVDDVVGAFLRAKEKQGVSARHLSTLRSHLNRFAGWANGIPFVDLLTPKLDSWLCNTLNFRTRLNMRISLVTLFAWAQRHHYLPDGATAAAGTMKPIIAGQDPEILTPDEMRGLLAECHDPGLRLFVAIGGFAGLRPSEIERLRWRHVGVLEDSIILGRDITKTKRRRVVPIRGNLRAWLLETGDGGQVDDPVTGTRMHRKLEQACRAAGLQWKHNALRHSSISYAMALDKDAAKIAEEHGHSVARLQESYKANVTEAAARDWYSIIP